MACDKQPSFGSLLEQLIMASYAMRIDLGKRVLERVESQVAELTRERDEARGKKAYTFQVRFDGPPGPESGRFVECETLDGKGVNVGHWTQDGEDWLLVVEGYDAPARLESEVTRLTEALAAAERRVSDLKLALGNGAGWFDRARAAEARVRELLASLEVATATNATQAESIRAAESRLAAANALLERFKARIYRHEDPDLFDATVARLAAQPATASARDCADHWGADCPNCDLAERSNAELAREVAKR